MNKQYFTRDEVKTILREAIKHKENKEKIITESRSDSIRHFTWDMITRKHKEMEKKYNKSNPELAKAHNWLSLYADRARHSYKKKIKHFSYNHSDKYEEYKNQARQHAKAYTATKNYIRNSGFDV